MKTLVEPNLMVRDRVRIPFDILFSGATGTITGTRGDLFIVTLEPPVEGHAAEQEFNAESLEKIG